MFLSTTGKHRKTTETFFGIKERKINDKEYRINISDIDESYINTIQLEPGTLFILSESLLYLFENDFNKCSIIFNLSYIKQSESTYSMDERKESFINGTNINKYLFTQPHYTFKDKERLYNLFDISIFKDNGLFLYNS